LIHIAFTIISTLIHITISLTHSHRTGHMQYCNISKDYS